MCYDVIRRIYSQVSGLFEIGTEILKAPFGSGDSHDEGCVTRNLHHYLGRAIQSVNVEFVSDVFPMCTVQIATILGGW